MVLATALPRLPNSAGQWVGASVQTLEIVMHAILPRFAAALSLLASSLVNAQIDGPLIVAPGINGGSRVDTIVPADGLPLVVYSEPGAVRALKCGDTTCTSGNVISLVVPFNVRRVRLALGTDGLPVIGLSVTSSGLRMARCLNAACSSTTLNIIDPANLGSATDHALVVPGDGRPLFAYYDSNNFDLKYARCTDASCSSSTVVLLDSVGFVGNAPALTLVGGLPQIAYNGSGLRLARCGTLDCPAATINTLTTDNAQDIAMMTGRDGFAMIAYRHDQALLDALRLVKCNDSACSTHANTLLDSTNTGVGLGNAVTLRAGADGLPVMSYIDFSFAAVKVLRCSRQDCLTTNITTVHAPDGGVVTTGHLGLAVHSANTPLIAYTVNGTNGLRLSFCNTRSCL